jgi:hypothetical protein
MAVDERDRAFAPFKGVSDEIRQLAGISVPAIQIDRVIPVEINFHFLFSLLAFLPPPSLAVMGGLVFAHPRHVAVGPDSEFNPAVADSARLFDSVVAQPALQRVLMNPGNPRHLRRRVGFHLQTHWYHIYLDVSTKKNVSAVRAIEGPKFSHTVQLLTASLQRGIVNLNPA